MSHLAALAPLRQIGVFRALQLGDLLCSVPALRALRRAAPQSSISLIGLPWARDFVERFGEYLDEFVEFPGYPGLPEREPDSGAIPAFLGSVQARRFDLVIQMHGSGGITNPLVATFGARHVAGFAGPGVYCPDPDLFLPFPEGENEVRMHLRLMQHLDIPAEDEALEFPLTARDRFELASTPEAAPLVSGEYACVHPGARLPSRRWPVERFAAVADELAATGLSIVLTGSEDERVLTGRVQSAMRAPAINLAGRTNLGALGALIGGARLVICNDTGVSHVAAALQTPSVVIASGSDPVRWTPLDQRRHRVLWHPIECRPCGHHTCPIGHPCALGVDVDQVIEAAAALLSAGGSVAPVSAGVGGS